MLLLDVARTRVIAIAVDGCAGTRRPLRYRHVDLSAFSDVVGDDDEDEEEDDDEDDGTLELRLDLPLAFSSACLRDSVHN